MEEVLIRSGIFLEGSSDVRLAGNRCKFCNQVFFPKTDLCPLCSGRELEEIALSKKGKLFTYTVVEMLCGHYTPPFAVGYIEMPEGVKIFSPLQMVSGKPFVIGMEMELKKDILWTEADRRVIGYRFKPL